MFKSFRTAGIPAVIAAVLHVIAGGRGVIAAERPNVLIIMADDCTYNDLPAYGGLNARTPHIDRLASQGLTFNRAYVGSAMCQPCRAELFTGQYPLRNGCAWNHSASRPTVASMPHHLRKLGYRVGLAGKVHVKPAKAFPFEKVGGFDPDCVRHPTREHDLGPIREFMTREASRPFCLVVALVEPHVPWVMGDASQYPPAKIKLPPNIADTPRTRADFARYLAEITYMDGQVGEILKTLDEAGRAGNTLVLFTSEQGAQFPGCKWTNWDTGLHTALIARWPGRIAASRRTSALVQYADVLPTLVEAAGGELPDHACDGTSFLPVLLGGKSRHRQYVYGMHNNIPEGPAYPIRTVSDGRYRYIRNLRPEELYIEKHLMGLAGGGKLNNPYWATWLREAWADPHTYKLVKRYMRRPAEQLYHTADDPYELTNLVDDAAFAEIKARLSRELDRWMHEQKDPGAEVDTARAIQAARRGKHLQSRHRTPKSPPSAIRGWSSEQRLSIKLRMARRNRLTVLGDVAVAGGKKLRDSVHFRRSQCGRAVPVGGPPGGSPCGPAEHLHPASACLVADVRPDSNVEIGRLLQIHAQFARSTGTRVQVEHLDHLEHHARRKESFTGTVVAHEAVEPAAQPG